MAQTILTVSSRFVGIPDIEQVVYPALADLARLCGAERATLNLYNKDDPTLATIYLWKKTGGEIETFVRHNILVRNWSWLADRMDSGKVLHLLNPGKLPARAKAEKKDFQELGINSVLGLPLRISGQPAGFLALVNISRTRDWGKQELAIIKGAAEIIGNALERQQETLLYRNLTDSAPMGIYISQQGKFVYVNPRFQDITGYDVPELLGTESLKLVHPKDKQRLVDDTRARLKNVQPAPNNYRIIKKNGDIAWIMETVTAIRYEGRRATLGFFTDITRYRDTIETLHGLEEKLRSMYQSTSEGIAIFDLDGTLIEGNDQMARMHGMNSKDELIGKHAWELTINQSRESWQTDISRIIDQKVVSPYENTFRKADGTEFSGEVSGSVCLDAAGKPTSLVFITRDITRRKQVQAQIALNNTLLTAASESTIDGIMAVSNKFKLILTNERFHKMFEVPSDLIEAGDYFPIREHLISLVTEPEKYLELSGILNDNPTLEQNYEFELLDGRTIERYSSPLIDPTGSYHGRINYYRDITEKKSAILKEKQLQEEIYRTNRLASIGEMAAGIAHEINNPMTSVIGFAQVLLNKDIPNDIKETLGIITSEAQRVARIVEGLLNFSRGSHTGEEIVEINHAVQQVLDMRAYQMSVHNIEYVLDFDEKLPPVRGNTNQLKQVFLNIVLNAEQEMGKAHGRGILTITTRSRDDHVRISFRDDGPGIPAENIDKLFDPFFTTSDGGKGTGRGLSICHGIITAHRGKISVRSREGQGATFDIELPVARTGKTD
jgi:PAS domain S-box-containing protein